MKKYLVMIFLFAFIYRGNAQTIIGGVFFSNTTLTLSNSPYHVTSNVLVPIGVSVNIEPGVTLYFDTGILWTVEGEFQAIGNASDSIKFFLQTGNSGKWGGIAFNPSAVPYDAGSGTGCILDYCVISKADEYPVWIAVTTVFILHSEVKNCNGGIYAYGSGDVIKHTHIHDCTSQSFTTWYGFIYPLPVIIDSCEIDHITASTDALRVTHNAIFSNNCVHDISSPFGALGIFEGPDVEVTGNNFYNNNTSAIIMVDGPDSTVKILNNNFTNNQINISKSACYTIPIVTGNNFYSYIDYNIYCTDMFGLGGPVCNPIPNGSFYTLDMMQNYFAHNSGSELDSSVYDLYDNWIGRTIIAYDTNIVTPYPNYLNCDSIFFTAVPLVNPGVIENSVILYPNPFNDKLNILTNENGSSEIIFYDILSRELLQQVFTHSIILNTTQLPKGIYIYEVRNKKGVIEKGKVVKD